MKETIGFLAGILTTFSGLPQLLYSYKHKDVKSFTLKFLFLLIGGLALWVLYGLLIKSLPIILFNSIAICLWIPILGMKIKMK
ncbi:MAG: hypothetical protein LWW94_00245 [Candidatus Desulfofervidaceae bacterium]|nr:hypothetical protein [Candidatus Desulfofervidaceae bacterium]